MIRCVAALFIVSLFVDHAAARTFGRNDFDTLAPEYELAVEGVPEITTKRLDDDRRWSGIVRIRITRIIHDQKRQHRTGEVLTVPFDFVGDDTLWVPDLAQRRFLLSRNEGGSLAVDYADEGRR